MPKWSRRWDIVSLLRQQFLSWLFRRNLKLLCCRKRLLAATELRAGHAQHVAQYPEERRVAIDIDRPIDAVDLDREGHG